MGKIAVTVTRRGLRDRDSDREWWLAQPAIDRIAHVEELRAEYYGWTDETQPRLQRVYRIMPRV